MTEEVPEPTPKTESTPTLLESPERVLATLNKDGSRRYIRPRLSEGAMWKRRRAVAWVLMIVFVLVPHVRIGGEPLMLLDVPGRAFHFFGTTFRATDTYLLMLAAIATLLGVFGATALFGRAWCGWACPQTVYMEFLFRPLDRLFEGSYHQQQQADAAGLSGRRIAKNVVIALISCFLAHTFLAYFVRPDQLLEWVQGSPAQHPVAFLVMAGVTAAMVFNFTWFREQTCLVVCPYGRFQSVLLDKSSLIVSYDETRGEPRGKKRKKKLPMAEDAPPVGDCVDCKACVITCPTGIDIRNGLQMECVHCTQCMDACDAIMGKLGRPLGLIRYASQDENDGKQRRLIRPRVVIYALGLALVATLLALALSQRGATKITALRGQGQPFQVLEDGTVSSTIRLRIQNQGAEARTYTISAPGLEGELVAPENPLTVEAEQVKTSILFVNLPQRVFSARGRKQIKLVVTAGEFEEEVPWTVLGPAQ